MTPAPFRLAAIGVQSDSMRVLIVTICAGVVFTAAAVAATPPSGVSGLVERGPIAPVCVAGLPCSAPARHVRVVFLRGSRVAGQATTDDAGKYRLALPAGAYTVQVAGRMMHGSGADMRTVHVPATRWVKANFSLDTGIR